MLAFVRTISLSLSLFPSIFLIVLAGNSFLIFNAIYWRSTHAEVFIIPHQLMQIFTCKIPGILFVLYTLQKVACVISLMIFKCFFRNDYLNYWFTLDDDGREFFFFLQVTLNVSYVRLIFMSCA